MEATMQDIRQAVIKRHGGFEHATDRQVLAVWNALPADTQKQYLADKTAKTKGTRHVIGPGPERNL